MRVEWKSQFYTNKDGNPERDTYTGEVVGYASPGYEVVAIVRSSGGLEAVQLHRLKVIDG